MFMVGLFFFLLVADDAVHGSDVHFPVLETSWSIFLSSGGSVKLDVLWDVLDAEDATEDGGCWFEG